jgi:hypothetical protein
LQNNSKNISDTEVKKIIFAAVLIARYCRTNLKDFGRNRDKL